MDKAQKSQFYSNLNVFGTFWLIIPQLDGADPDRIQTLALMICDYLLDYKKQLGKQFLLMTLVELQLLLTVAAELVFLNHIFNNAFINNMQFVYEDPTGAAFPLKGM